MLANLTIKRKLTMLCAVFLLPMALQTWLYASQVNKDLSFTNRELAGARYLGVTQALQLGVVGHHRALGNSGPAAAETLRRDLASLEAVGKDAGTELDLVGQTADAVKAVQAYLALPDPEAPGRQAAAMARLGELTNRVGDNAGLTNDPELDCFYTFDALLRRLPILIDRMSAVSDIAVGLAAGNTAGADQKANFQIRKGQFAISLEGLSRDLAAAFRNNGDASLRAALEAPFGHARVAHESLLRALERVADDGANGKAPDDVDVMVTRHAEALQALAELWQRTQAEGVRLIATRKAILQRTLALELGATLVALMAAIFMAWTIARSVEVPLAAIKERMARLAIAGDTTIVVPYRHRTDEVGQMAGALETFREAAVRAIRNQTALENVSTIVTVADTDGKIVSANKAASDHFKTVAGQFGKAFIGFDPARLVGETLDRFLPDAGELTAHLRESQTRRLQLGERIFDLTVSPVINGHGDRLGVAVEWRDMTEQLAVEHEVAGLVAAAARGNFEGRLQMSDKTGFMRQLSEGTNQLVATVQQSLHEVVLVTSALAGGDLTRRVTADFHGEFAKLKEDVNGMCDRLTSILASIGEAAVTVNTAASEISQGSEELASRTEQQAANLEETAGAMEELTATVRQNSNNAQKANHLAAAAHGAAAQGGGVVSEVIGAMARIEDSSDKISEIITVLEEIAFQTNLLALNAAVEAARAGEAGKGFAVVATEVRSLAQRSSQASKEIKDLILRSNNQVKEGGKLVGDAGTALGEIVHSVKTVADIIAEIAAASREQSAGLNEINTAIAQMEEGTQKNAALVEQTSAATQSLATQAGELVDLLSFFDTGGSRHPATAPARHRLNDDRAVALEARPHSKARADGPPRRALIGRTPTTSRAEAARVAGDDADWKEF